MGMEIVDDCGTANYCIKVVSPLGTEILDCGTDVNMAALAPLGLTTSGCMNSNGFTFCLCDTNTCN